MELQLAVAKVAKYAVSESGDTLEMIERPHGGVSLVLADGQRSGQSAKRISNVVARKAIQLLAEGVRDGAVARAAHDYLYTYRQGKVSATLNILSVDTQSKTIVISRNNPAPVVVHTSERGTYLIDEPAPSIGFHRNVKPSITEIPIVPGTYVVAFTDGFIHAGSLSGGERIDACALMVKLLDERPGDPQAIADGFLHAAVTRDQGRPRDDISVAALVVLPRQGDDVRRMVARMPL